MYATYYLYGYYAPRSDGMLAALYALSAALYALSAVMHAGQTLKPLQRTDEQELRRPLASLYGECRDA